MWAGVPPVVLADSAVSRMVEDGATGRVAPDAAAYPDIVAGLLDSPAERKRLGAAAADHARDAFDPARNVARIMAALGRLCEQPKRARGALFDTCDDEGPAAFFARLSGPEGEALLDAALAPGVATIAAAVGALRHCSPLHRIAEGGLFHFRNHHAQNPTLALWSGAALMMHGDPARGAAEIAAARRLGADPWIAQAYSDAASAS